MQTRPESKLQFVVSASEALQKLFDAVVQFCSNSEMIASATAYASLTVGQTEVWTLNAIFNAVFAVFEILRKIG